jgi:hypothetical protein
MKGVLPDRPGVTVFWGICEIQCKRDLVNELKRELGYCY